MHKRQSQIEHEEKLKQYSALQAQRKLQQEEKLRKNKMLEYQERKSEAIQKLGGQMSKPGYQGYMADQNPLNVQLDRTNYSPRNKKKAFV